MVRAADQIPERCRYCGQYSTPQAVNPRPPIATFEPIHGLYRDSCDRCINSSRNSCLSSEPHDDIIKDHLDHYLSCIEFCDREDFFNPNSALWQIEARHRIGLRKRLHPTESREDRGSFAKDEVDKKRKQWKDECEYELDRIQFLRATLSRDPKEGHLNEKVDESRQNWRHGDRPNDYKRNISKVRLWRREHLGKPVKTIEELYPPTPPKQLTEYNPEKDASVPVILFEGGQVLEKAEEPVECERKDRRIWGSFPDQKTTVQHLFSDRGNEADFLLHKDRTRAGCATFTSLLIIWL